MMWFDNLMIAIYKFFDPDYFKPGRPLRFEDFRCPTPQDMPLDYFPRVKKLDYPSAIKADVSKLELSAWSVEPRCWYIDAWFDCEQCNEEFCWTAKEQQYWFEELHFWIDSYPKLCLECRKKRRKIPDLQRKYGRMAKIAIRRTTELKTKQQALELINEIEQMSGEPLTCGIAEKRDILMKQIEKMKETSGD